MIEMRPAFDSSALAPVGDRDFGRAFQVDAAVVGREGVGRQIEHLAARFDAADSHRPAVFLEGAIDVGGHHIGRVHPAVFLALDGRPSPPRRRIPRPAPTWRRRAGARERAACTRRRSGCRRSRAVLSRRRNPACPSACRCRADSSARATNPCRADWGRRR